MGNGIHKTNGNEAQIQYALQYARAGLSVLPIACDGTKQPPPGRPWKQFQQRIATEREIKRLFAGPCGIAIIGGKVSGNLETLDIDAPELVDAYEAAVEELAPGLIARLCAVASPRANWGGRHYRYRIQGAVAGNTKLAESELRPQFNKDGAPQIDTRTGKQRWAPETLIETRGEGGYAIAPGSAPGCHETGRQYKHVGGPPLTEIPIITADEHRILWLVARTFNRYVPEQHVTAVPTNYQNVNSPGNDFNARATWDEVLIPAGWTHVRTSADLRFWRRPGKAIGTSATTGIRSLSGKELLCVFSTNAYPLEIPAGRQCGAFTKFSAFTLLNHEGNYSAAAKELRKRGYGSKSATKSSDGKAFDTPATDTAGRKLQIVRLDTVTAKAIEYLWRDRIAIGKATMIAGDPGFGKSTASRSIIATVTTGGRWPDDAPSCAPGNVIILAAEDGIADTVAPKLIEAGADMTKVHAIQGVEYGSDERAKRIFNFKFDVPLLVEAITEVGNVKLVVIDPIMSYLDGVDTNKGGDVRSALQPLVEAAEESGTAVLMVTHLSKAQARSALSATTGSHAFGALVRQAHLVVPDPGDPTGNRRLFLCMKSNICRKPPGLVFEVRDDGIRWFAELVNVDADDALRKANKTEGTVSKLEAAKEWLQKLGIDRQPMPASEVRKLAESDGITYTTLARAFNCLHGVANRDGYQGAVTWQIPDAPAAVSESSHTFQE